MTNPITFREALVTDAPEITDMTWQLAAHHGMPEEEFGVTVGQVERIITSESNAHYFVAEHLSDPPRLIGMMLCNRLAPTWRGVPPVYVEDLYAVPEFRNGQGVGTGLMAQAAKLAVRYAGDKPAAASLRLDASKYLADTVRYYTRLGMEAENYNFRMSGADVVQLAARAA